MNYNKIIDDDYYSTVQELIEEMIGYVEDECEEISYIANAEKVQEALSAMMADYSYNGLHTNLNTDDTVNLYAFTIDEDYNVYVKRVGNRYDGYVMDFNGAIILDDRVPYSFMAHLDKNEYAYVIVHIDEFEEHFECDDCCDCEYYADCNDCDGAVLNSPVVYVVKGTNGDLMIF